MDRVIFPPLCVPGIGIVLAVCLGVAGCNRSSGGSGVIPAPPPGNPMPLSIVVEPSAAAAGDTITISGFDFALDPAANEVTFSGTGIDPIQLAGVVIQVLTGAVDPQNGLETTLEVIVPTGVRTGLVTLVSGGSFVGTADFTGAPVVIGAAVGNFGDLGFVWVPAGVPNPETVTFYGYNLEAVTAATVTDTLGNVEPADVAPGLGPLATYTLPAGMEAVTVTIQSGLVILCAGGLGASVPMTFDLETTTSGTTLPANTVQVHFTADLLETLPSYFAGAFVASGVRSGDVPITWHFCQQPAQDRWDCVPHYRDPATGDFLPCTPAPASRSDGLGLLPGITVMSSEIGAFIGSGHPYEFIWDSRADLGATLTTTAVRLLGEDPVPGTTVICEAAAWTTETIVIDNTTFLGGGTGLFEDFETNQFEDADLTDAFWAVGGRLVGNPAPVPVIETPTGNGFADVVLKDGDFLFDTSAGELTDETDFGNPIVLLDAGNNPGADRGEFHVRTLMILDTAVVEVVGDNPLVIRASGTGDTDEIVVRLNSILDLDGDDGGFGTDDVAGSRGVGAVGGHDGGSGGEVTVISAIQIIDGYTPAQDGGGGGGEAGQGITYLKASGNTNAKGGSGGGGGYSSRGGDATIQASQNVFGALGRGGPVRGDAAITVLDGGSGGGGGGAVALRLGGTAPVVEPRNGGGGGAGGGAIEVVVDGSVEILGTITANGGDGGNGAPPNGGPAGGGSGGAIAVRASGNVHVDAATVLLARGGFGGGTGQFRGGDGADGRIRFDVNGAISLPALIDLDNLMPPLDGSPVHTTVGIVAGPFSETATGTIDDTGDGSDGPLDLAGIAGPVIIDTDTNEVRDANGVTVVQGVSGTPGVFNWSNLSVPEGDVLRGVGSNPLILKVGGPLGSSAEIRGTIDVSGFDGGEVTFPLPPGGPLPGAGGVPGPGGGAGGTGGIDGGATVADGELGGFPGALPDGLIDLEPPYDGSDGTGTPIPIPLATPAVGGGTVSTACDVADPCKAGSGGGGGHGAAGEDAVTVDALGDDGQGGSAFGSFFFRSPLDGADLPVGGGGGAGGGGNANGDGVTSHSPGSGGGGGGGFVRLSVKGALVVGSPARILAEGGDASQSVVRGGNGGAGAGGGVHIQGTGAIAFESDPDTGTGPIVSVLGGTANEEPLGHVGNGEVTGGDGAAGRIRIESPVGVSVEEPEDCGPFQATGICPPPTVGPFDTFGTVASRAVSKPYPMLAEEAPVFGSPTVFAQAVVNRAPLPQPPGTVVRVLYSGARESTTTPGTAGEFTTPVADISLLDGSEYLRIHAFLFSNAMSGEVPSVEDIEVDGSF